MTQRMVFFGGLLIGTLLSFNGIQAQDTTTAYTDSLRSHTDSTKVQQVKKQKFKEFKQAFKKLIKRDETKKEETQETQDDVVTDPQLNLGGFVLDETRSRTGRTFYQLFYRYWQAPKDANYYTITISEQPTPRRGTQIIITMNYERILSFRLQPRYHFIEKISKQAVGVVYQKLKKQSSIKDQLIF